ncbi:zinc ribbon domain-containing protein [archaeon SCG-AAA382B04]|nr:zinc ribbon domain-containing protein [archaeon SCG-AAA382B04]
MGENKLIPFTDNFSDNSSKAGFKFTFFCDKCGEGYKTKFIKSKTSSKKGLFDAIGKAASALGRATGRYNIGRTVDDGTDIVSEKYSGKSAAWRKEHEKAFEKAQNEAKGYFNRCPSCTKWVCDNCWNGNKDLCIGCAPRESVEVSKARADRMSKEIEEQAKKTDVFTGDMDEQEVICPECGKPAGKGDFCTNCGASLEMKECPKCGAKNQTDAAFCGECGTNLK